MDKVMIKGAGVQDSQRPRRHFARAVARSRDDKELFTKFGNTWNAQDNIGRLCSEPTDISKVIEINALSDAMIH